MKRCNLISYKMFTSSYCRLQDFLDLMKTQFGDKTKAEMEEMLKSGMSMEQVNTAKSIVII